jgi:hypothetical protein
MLLIIRFAPAARLARAADVAILSPKPPSGNNRGGVVVVLYVEAEGKDRWR